MTDPATPDRRALLQGMGASLCAAMVPLPALSQSGPSPTGYLRTNWSRDPFALGSYSYMAKGSRKADRRALEKPIAKRIFFAGEAVFPKHNSTVHAAYQSGLRTAGQLAKNPWKRVAIIGAGMSGLAAAHKLSEAGLDVTVFEARNRIGGRLWTDNSLGMPLDLGASWIHGITDNPVASLASRHGMGWFITDDSGVIRGRDGREIRDQDAPDWLEDVTEVQNSFGADPDDINYTAYSLEVDFGGEEVVFPGGYSRILDGLKAGYETRLSTQVSKVALGSDEVWITPAGARAEMFDAVIVTVPLGVLKEGGMIFEPGLPKAKARAIMRLGMGVLDKLYLKYDRAFWDPDVTWLVTPETDLQRGQFNLWLNLQKVFGVPIVVAFNGGTPARQLSSLSDKELVSQAAEVLKNAYSS